MFKTKKYLALMKHQLLALACQVYITNWLDKIKEQGHLNYVIRC